MPLVLRHTMLALATAAMVFLAGCGDKEPDQRKAFIGFLQTRVLDKPGVHVPQLTEDEKTSFGPYAENWTIITAFHKTMDESVAPKMKTALSKGGFTSLDDIVARRGDIRDVVATMDDMAVALTGDLATADAAHAHLKQPDDLKTVYDAVYERLVTLPSKAFADVTPVFDGVMNSTLKLTDYVDAHADRVKIAGGGFQVSDVSVKNQVDALVHDIQAHQTELAAAQTRMQSTIYGK
jgi:hypothetical protein